MAEIILSTGHVTQIDDCDFGWLSKWRWTALRAADGTYRAIRSATKARKNITVYMHREIIGAPKGVFVDHINRNPLDIRRANLRFATREQNGRNRSATSAVGFKGVYRDRTRFRAYIYAGRSYFLGAFATAEEAARAYDDAALKHHGDFAATNVSLGLLPPLAGS